MKRFATAVLAMLIGGGSQAQTAEDAALANMWLVIDVCLQNHRSPSAIPDALEAAGVVLTPNAIPDNDFTLVDPSVRSRQWDFTIADVTGYVALPDVEAFGARCVVGTPIIDQAQAAALIWQAYDYRFPGLARPRGPQAADDCDMVVATAEGNALMMEALVPDPQNRCGPGQGAAIHMSM